MKKKTNWEKHPESEQYLKTRYDTAMNLNWKTPVMLSRVMRMQVSKKTAGFNLTKNKNKEMTNCSCHFSQDCGARKWPYSG